MKELFLILITISVALCDKFRFDNYTLYKILPKGDNQIEILRDLRNSDSRYDFWTEPAPAAGFVSVLSSPADKGILEELLTKNDIRFEIPMSNIQEAIDKEVVRTYTRNNFRSMQWNVYYTLDDIYAWLDDIAEAHPNVATKIIAGTSFEGREIKGIKVSHGPGRKAIFVESGIHAREWITMATACYTLNELLTSNNPETMAAVRDYDWYVFPVTNPDGYVWSHEQFRMWRKNRRPIGSNFGVDLNRNWNSNWLVVGASTNPASDVYAGPGPFSEPESRSLSAYIRSVPQIEMYLSVHSFGQLILVPFGNTSEPLANYHDAIHVSRRAIGALSVRFNTQYMAGNIVEALSMATGGSDEWAKEHMNIPLVYCYELRDRGQFGFLLPADQILPNSQEVMDSFLELIHQGKRIGLYGVAAGTYMINKATKLALKSSNALVTDFEQIDRSSKRNFKKLKPNL